MDISVDEMARAFTEWDRRWRKNPERFYSETERLGTGKPENYGEWCAPYFVKILDEQAAAK